MERRERCVSESVWETYVELGDNAYRNGFYDLAQKMLTAALIEVDRLETVEEGLAPVLNNLGAVYSEQERYKKAEILHKRALETQERLLGSDDPRLSRTLALLAGALSAQSKFTPAQRYLKRALAITRRAHGKRSCETLGILTDLIAILKKCGSYPAAVRLDELAFSIRRQTKLT
jgi:tetratricopeptide (TPR) repeat protein